MKFGAIPIPQSLFDAARKKMHSRVTFTPGDIRTHLLLRYHEDLYYLSPIQANRRIIVDRVVRECIKQLRASGDIVQVKHGMWSSKKMMESAEAPASSFSP